MGTELDVNKITAEVITELSKDMARKLFGKVKDFFVDLKNKDEVDFGYAFENYLSYSKEIHEKIKTLLYRHTPKPIYSFYECIGVRGEKGIIDTSDINNLLSVGNRLIISGTGGIGKSVMMKHLFLSTLQNTGYVPVLIELRGLNEYDEKTLDIEEYIYKVMHKLKFQLEKKYFNYSLEVGGYVLLFDGFDEVKNELSQKVTQEIFAITERYPDNYYLVSSRPLEEFVGWSQFEELHALPLNKEQALELISKLEYDEKIKEKFYHELKEYLYEKYKTFASNPLLLTIMLLTFENRASIPDKLNDFFEQAFTTLFHTHDATKGGYKRDILSGLGYEDFKLVFAYFCFKSFFNSDYKFTENQILNYISMAKTKEIIDKNFNSMDYLKDLTNSICMVIHEGLEYRFTHRAFQEYFAALYTVQLDDEQQRRFLKLWLQNESYRATSNYLDMLYELQPSRFIKNIISPAIKELHEKYIDNGESNEWLIRLMYSDVGVRKYSKEKNKRCFVTIKEFYYHDMIIRACNVGGLFKSRTDEENQRSEKREAKLRNILEEKYRLDKEQSFDTLAEDGYMEEVLEGLQWIVDRYEFAVEYIEGYDNSSLSRKKKFSSMLDEL